MFNVTLRRVATLAITFAALNACDADPLVPYAGAPGRVSTVTTTPSGNVMSRDEATVPFSFGVYAPCANDGQGEVLGGTGQLHYRGHWLSTTDGQGGERVHSAVILGFSGSAVGWDTGEEYDVATREVDQVNTAYGTDGIPDSGENLQRIRMRLTSRATGAVIDIVLVGRFVQTATGEWVLDGWDGTARCR